MLHERSIDNKYKQQKNSVLTSEYQIVFLKLEITLRWWKKYRCTSKYTSIFGILSAKYLKWSTHLMVMGICIYKSYDLKSYPLHIQIHS